jgi:hypothetical protein
MVRTAASENEQLTSEKPLLMVRTAASKNEQLTSRSKYDRFLG